MNQTLNDLRLAFADFRQGKISVMRFTGVLEPTQISRQQAPRLRNPDRVDLEVLALSSPSSIEVVLKVDADQELDVLNSRPLFVSVLQPVLSVLGLASPVASKPGDFLGSVAVKRIPATAAKGSEVHVIVKHPIARRAA